MPLQETRSSKTEREFALMLYLYNKSIVWAPRGAGRFWTAVREHDGSHRLVEMRANTNLMFAMVEKGYLERVPGTKRFKLTAKGITVAKVTLELNAMHERTL